MYREVKFQIQVLAKVMIGRPNSNIEKSKIVTTTVVCDGDLFQEYQYIEHYSHLEEHYEYDIKDAEVLYPDEFEVIGANGKIANYLAGKDEIITELLEIYEEEVLGYEEL